MTKNYAETKIVDVDNSDKLQLRVCILHPEYYTTPQATFFSVESDWMGGLFYCVIETAEEGYKCYCTDHMLTDQACYHISMAKAEKDSIVLNLIATIIKFGKRMRTYIQEALFSVRVNKYITLKLRGGAVRIYVEGKEFMQCKYLLFINPHLNPKQDTINSIDEAKQYLGRSSAYTYKITPEQEFWGHASNIQTWAENGYDTRLIHSNLGFPLLKRLMEVGDPMAKKMFKEEIVKRFDSGFLPTVKFLANGNYLEVFTEKQELDVLERISQEKYGTSFDTFKKNSYYIEDELEEDFEDDLDLEEELDLLGT